MAWGMDFSQMDLFLNSTSTIYLLFDFGHTILSLTLRFFICKQSTAYSSMDQDGVCIVPKIMLSTF